MKNKKYTSATFSTPMISYDGIVKHLSVNTVKNSNGYNTYSFDTFVTFGGLQLYRHSHYFCYSGDQKVFYRKISKLSCIFLYWIVFKSSISSLMYKSKKHACEFFTRKYIQIKTYPSKIREKREMKKFYKDWGF